MNEAIVSDVVFNPVTRELLYRQVAEQLRESILNGELSPGEALPAERDLAERLGVGRASVREALRVLQAQGLLAGGRGSPSRLVVAPGLGAPVSEGLVHLMRLQQISLADLMDLRCALEVAAVERAASCKTGAHLQEAGAALEEMCIMKGDVESYHKADVRFHIALVAASGNQAMDLVMVAVRDAIAHYLLETLRAYSDPSAPLHRLSDQHRAIFEAVEAGDGHLAGKLMREHIIGFYQEALLEADGADEIVTA